MRSHNQSSKPPFEMIKEMVREDGAPLENLFSEKQ
jgi:hypothetical protein